MKKLFNSTDQSAILKESVIEYFGKDLYIGYIPKIKGLIVQGNTIEEVKHELLVSLKVKFAYDYNLDITNVNI